MGYRIAIYGRKSKFTGKGESIENQIELCQKYISQHIDGGLSNEVCIFEDEGYSGKNLDRPEFKEMMAMEEAEKFNYIICYRLDRISRSVSDFSSLIEVLYKKGTGFICIKEQFDTTNPMGKAMMYIASVFSQLERETIAERIRDNMYMLSKTGRWLGGNTPTGFRSECEERVAFDDKVRTSFKLVAVPEEMDIVRLIFDKFKETHSICATTRFLMQNGVLTKNGRAFSNTAVKAILKNPVYAGADADSYQFFLENEAELCFDLKDCEPQRGFMPYNRTDNKNKYQVKNEMSKWIIAVGKHPAVISGREWVELQKVLLSKKHASTAAMRSPHISDALLSGLIVCGDCGGFMRPRIYSNRIRADHRIPCYYSCETKEKTSRIKCQMGNIDQFSVDTAVVTELFSIDTSELMLRQGLVRIEDKIENCQPYPDSAQRVLERQLAECKAKIENLLQAIMTNGEDDFSVKLIRQKINSLGQQCEHLEKEISLAASCCGEQKSQMEQYQCVIRSLSTTRSSFETHTIVEKRELIRKIVGKVIWDGSNIHIYLVDA